MRDKIMSWRTRIRSKFEITWTNSFMPLSYKTQEVDTNNFKIKGYNYMIVFGMDLGRKALVKVY